MSDQENTTAPTQANEVPESTPWPVYDVTEYETKILIAVDLPGMDKDSFDVEFDAKAITISGTRNAEEAAEGGTILNTTRFMGEFKTYIELPTPVEKKTVKASYKNGVLLIKARKPDPTQEKTVRIVF
eukprot:GCRY01000300.1.p1 GENE.GCRY01000300.1~~GCRY01000300.1.p1  ORF type:complete len:128 (-),score=28.34 GCRY01000300.1:169-552(-)